MSAVELERRMSETYPIVKLCEGCAHPKHGPICGQVTYIAHEICRCHEAAQ